MGQRYRFDGGALKRLIRASGKPAEQVALDVGRTKESLVAYMSGKVTPSLGVVTSLAAALGCPVEALFIVEDDLPAVADRARAASRKQQGLPAKVRDRAALDEAAQLLRRHA
jgi:DNA-binding XRE family transcriptional regulator